MIFFEHHLGDHIRKTMQLTMVEEGAYRRLLDAYYMTEQPIPRAFKDACRVARATSKRERDAVCIVLGRFFHETSQGWLHTRCESEIAHYKEKRVKAQRSAFARWGTRNPQEGDANASDVRSAGAIRTHTERDAHHTPAPNPQSPSPADATHSPAVDVREHAERVCEALKEAGIDRVNPADPTLLSLLQGGATLQHFTAAVEGSMRKHNPFAYALGTVKGQLAEAAQIAMSPRPSPSARAPTLVERRSQTTAELTGQTGERFDDEVRDKSTIDVDAKFLR
ncbi:DUF1376 domain-containing protein [Ramlibacter henchirensis]|uniref:DUF1376 domain-containing protein n=1 Tax=Ramlibacter henchirensis TaxID=204072 RepID=A0A4Z0BQ43_9BURK|nr:YdaU family protein [Ramlibacter henchirensis]TFZ00961.1 DUF1376 domain-containing protein [Ramlibacter henchirensis]